MAKKDLPCPTVLRQLLRYEPETGKLFWRERTPARFSNNGHSAAHNCAAWNARYAGQEAFTSVNDGGYRMANWGGRNIRAHRAIWAILYGRWPSGEIDHINGIRDDNRPGNLREVSGAENHKNMKRPKSNTSGVMGVSRWRKKWRATGGGNAHIGVFDSLDEAIEARETFCREQGYHPNHGRVTDETV